MRNFLFIPFVLLITGCSNLPALFFGKGAKDAENAAVEAIEIFTDPDHKKEHEKAALEGAEKAVLELAEEAIGLPD